MRLVILLSTIVSFAAFSQSESTLYSMNSLTQVVTENPAILPRYKFSLGIPGSSTLISYTNNGFAYNDLIKRENDSVKADFGKWLSKLANKNYTSISANTDLLRLGIRTKKDIYLMANVTAKGYGRFMFPKEMASLFVEGTGNFIGKSIQISPKVEGMGWLEAALGVSIPVNEKLRIGGRIKYLKGMASITTEKSDVRIEIDDNYAITANADLSLKTSGIQKLSDGDFTFSDFSGNSGLGLDMGATWQMLPKLQLSASIVDLGFINWKNDLTHYQLNPEKAQYTFEGLDLSQLLNGNEDYLDAEIDSLEKNFEVQELSGTSYKTTLPTRGFAAANYTLSKNTNVGALLFVESFRGRLAPGLTATVSNQLSKFVSTTVSYTMSNRSYGNIGAGLSLNFAPFQLYVVGDNILKLPFSLMANKNVNSYVNTTQVMNLRAGLNIVWGWQKTKVENQAKSGKPSKRNGRNNAVKIRDSR